MATAFTHGIVGATIIYWTPKKYHSIKNYIIASMIAISPDIDVISFFLKIPYDSFWGHRGFTHSIIIACILGITAAAISYSLTSYHNRFQYNYRKLSFIMTIAALSHSILDAFTNGGHGVAFFSPFINNRYFFPVHPIEVCSIGFNFFSSKAIAVLKSEFLIVILPLLILSICLGFYRSYKK